MTHHIASTETVPASPYLLCESFLERPTAFGVPLGVLLLFMFLIRTIKEANANARTVRASVSSQQQSPHVSTSNVFERVWCPHCDGKNVVHVSVLGTSVTCTCCRKSYVAALVPATAPQHEVPSQQFVDAACTTCGKLNKVERGNIGTLLFCEHCKSNFRFSRDAAGGRARLPVTGNGSQANDEMMRVSTSDIPLPPARPALVSKRGKDAMCPACKKPIRIPTEQAGVSIKCSSCGVSLKTKAKT